MKQKSILVKLFHLLSTADGTVNDRELTTGKQMIKAEGIDEASFFAELELLKKRNAAVVYGECLEDMRKLDRSTQVRCLAWMSLIANADGFMDKTEWQFIYRLYYTDLHLQLDEIMKCQKELMGLKEKAFNPALSL